LANPRRAWDESTRPWKRSCPRAGARDLSPPSSRALALAVTLATLPAVAQETGGHSAGPGLAPPPDYQTTVLSYRPSPPDTQTRQFTLSRFWRLDPGRYEVELWLDTQFAKHGEGSESTLKAEIEIGLSTHIQLDIYLNFGWASGGESSAFAYQGVSLEMRYSIASYYNAISWNPVLYFEFTTNKSAQDRFEFRFLTGGDLPFWGGLWASNFFVENNIDTYNGEDGLDMEIGVTASANFPVIKDWFRLGAELRTGVDQHGTSTFYGNFQIGPELVLTYQPANLKLTASALFGVCSEDPLVRLFLIAGWQF
jgi:hypothetical protein